MLHKFINALEYSAVKHTFQRRKGDDNIPYINHPIKVVRMLFNIGNVNDFEVLSAAILHDVLEDTDATESEMIELFGFRVTTIVKEVTDDMSLAYDVRKRIQIEKAPNLSNEAKLIKIADKISNINDIVTLPINWTLERKLQYVDWSQKVVNGCNGVNANLDKAFDEIFQKAQNVLKSE